MTKRSDIIDGNSAIGRKYGLIYTKRCGWVDLGHANPEGANLLWQQVLKEKDKGGTKSGYFRIVYKQMMGRKNLLKVGVLKKYDIRKGLNEDQKKSVALSIFLDVSHAFEGMQSNWLFRKITDSGYSAEDLVSNLIGFYQAVYPGKQFISLCEPVSKSVALDIWDRYGEVGSNKNYSTVPYIYPIPPSKSGPVSVQLPSELNTIKPAKQGALFKEVN
ncbi:hypothetical protein FKG94_22900 [Exilibacterium tricleocarpae]|uniref:Uncharacterized protein n=1 Tax=Exilibacterium tricleocarpae TaxID=2591008 RepID=A0A545SXF1_9GAMM|nr:hypothetical protein [Exilibacterium tricleocarpae]TQV69645.1 hypothetical protein FKG94_22900 [Exilibacterium tricleocarpae]